MQSVQVSVPKIFEDTVSLYHVTKHLIYIGSLLVGPNWGISAFISPKISFLQKIYLHDPPKR
jgi:hypothetical protein